MDARDEAGDKGRDRHGARAPDALLSSSRPTSTAAEQPPSFETDKTGENVTASTQHPRVPGRGGAADQRAASVTARPRWGRPSSSQRDPRFRQRAGLPDPAGVRLATTDVRRRELGFVQPIESSIASRPAPPSSKSSCDAGQPGHPGGQGHRRRAPRADATVSRRPTRTSEATLDSQPRADARSRGVVPRAGLRRAYESLRSGDVGAVRSKVTLRSVGRAPTPGRAGDDPAHRRPAKPRI